LKPDNCAPLLELGRKGTYRGVQFAVVATAEADIWEWRYELDNVVKTGRTQTRLAARRVRWKLDAALRAKMPSPPSPDPSAKSGMLTT